MSTKSRILVVGNILKDVYINVDPRTEKVEEDARGVKWINLGFNVSEHHFFRRNSSFGGTAITLEVLGKMGLDATASSPKFSYGQDGIVCKEVPSIYRYILVLDDQIAYLTPSGKHPSLFEPGNEHFDYIFIDRSAELNEKLAQKIDSYLELSPETKLVLCMRKHEDAFLRRLEKRAFLIFAESKAIKNSIYLSDTELVAGDVREPVTISKPDLSTHLSLYTIAATTIFGGMVLGRPTAECLKLARANMENSQLDATLSLEEMEVAASETKEDSDTLALLSRSLLGRKIVEMDDVSNAPDFATRQELRAEQMKTLTPGTGGVALDEEALEQFTEDGRSFVDYLTDRLIVPGIRLTWPETSLSGFYEAGVRFVYYRMDFREDLDKIARLALNAQQQKLVPVIFLNMPSERNKEENKTFRELAKKMQALGVNLDACILSYIKD